MSEQQDIVSPAESASQVGKRKARPGKAQRLANRSNVSQASATTAATSLNNQASFARKMSFTPTPQPGKYPIVFPSGAGEPTRDAYMAITGSALYECFGLAPTNYVDSARYAEFASHSEYEKVDFQKDVTTASILAVCQQIVHAHVNLGLPMGDFSSINSTEVYNPTAIRTIVHQFGEFSVGELGTRYLFKSYDHEVKALVRTAKRISKCETSNGILTILKEHWLPTGTDDVRTGFILAAKIAERLRAEGLTIKIDDLSEAIFHQASPAYNAAKAVLPADEKDLYDVLFSPYADKKAFIALFTGDKGKARLKNLDLVWTNRVEDSLLFDVTPKVEFPNLIQPWLRKKPTVTKFFHCGIGSAEKAVATGSAAQLSEVSTVSGVTVVKTHIAISAPEFSRLACFPPSVVYSDQVEKRVVQTTSIPISVRATEFMQMDWM